MTKQELLNKIVKRQGDMSDRAFAHKLGISHNQWNGTKSGTFPLGWTVCTAVALHFPELGEELLNYMSSVASTRQPKAA